MNLLPYFLFMFAMLTTTGTFLVPNKIAQIIIIPFWRFIHLTLYLNGKTCDASQHSHFTPAHFLYSPYNIARLNASTS